MKRILINATHAEEIRVALCNGNHLYDFDLENRTREQKKANIYKGRVTRVEPSLEAVFVEYGAERQGFLPIREIANEYLSGDPRSTNIKQLIKEGDELIVQVEKEERGNKGAALSTLVSLAGRYLVLMPNNARGGGISRQISGKVRDEMKQALADLALPKGMSVIIRTAGIGKTSEDLQHDLDHLLNIWKGIQQQNQKYPAPRLVHQEAGVVTRAVRDYLRDDITEIWVDNPNAYNEAANFIEAVMPQQLSKLRKYSDYEPMFARFGIEKQIETAYQREVRLPSGGSIVIDQTEALVSIDINSSKATKGADVSETAFNTNLEAADEIARQLRLRDMGGLIVIDFIDMASDDHQKQVENRIKEATKNDRARIQFAEISRFGLLEMSRQRLRPSLEEATGFLCPRCHGTGMIRDLRSLALSIMRQIEQKALQERGGEIQADVPTEIAAFLLNEKRDSLVYLEQESGTRITILPHAHMESPDFNLTYNREGFAPSSYERVTESEQLENKDRGYDTTNWHTGDNEISRVSSLSPAKAQADSNKWSSAEKANIKPSSNSSASNNATAKPDVAQIATIQPAQPAAPVAPQSSAVAWLSNLFAPTQQAQVAHIISSQDAAAAIENIVNSGAKSLGVQGQLNYPTAQPVAATAPVASYGDNTDEQDGESRNKRNVRKPKSKKSRYNDGETTGTIDKNDKSARLDSEKLVEKQERTTSEKSDSLPKREPNSRRDARGEKQRQTTLVNDNSVNQTATIDSSTVNQALATVATDNDAAKTNEPVRRNESNRDAEKNTKLDKAKTDDPAQVQVQVHKSSNVTTDTDTTVHLSLDNSKPTIVQDVAKDTRQASTQANKELSNGVEQTFSQQDNGKYQMTMPNVDFSGKLSTSETTATTLQKAEQNTEVETLKPQLEVIPMQGRAKNDPREVYRSFIQRFGAAQTLPTQSMPAPNLLKKITGTVQQFIETQLGQQNPASDNNVIANFIKAVEQFNQANSTDVTVSSDVPSNQSDSQSSEAFNQFFRNYGYQRLTMDNLTDYHQMITPANHFHATAGKTEATPAPVTKRASNDPRGQIAATSASNDNSQPQSMTVSEVVQDANSTADLQVISPVAATTVESLHNYHVGSVGAWIVAKLGEQGQTLINQGNLVAAYLLAHQTANNATSEPEIAKADSQPSASLTTQAADNSNDELPNEGESITLTLGKPVSADQLPQNINDNVGDANLAAEHESLQAKGKTTPSSYKNMIESVAEQLKPSPGSVLNLPTPKVPKARTRKTKTVEKPAAKPKTRTSKKVDNVVIVKKPKVETTENIVESDTNLPQQ